MLSLFLKRWDKWQRISPLLIAILESLALLLLGLAFRFLTDWKDFLADPFKNFEQAVIIMIVYGVIIYRHICKQR